jgi:hypothetical protein
LDIIKYFFEEPASLESLTPDDDPDARRATGPVLSIQALLAGASYHRGYLAGTNLASGRVGLTAVAQPGPVTEAVSRWLDRKAVLVSCTVTEGVHEISREELPLLLRNPSGIRVLAAGSSVPQEALLATAAAEPRRHAITSIRTLLDEGFDLLFPEPAHNGFDWSFFSAEPCRDTLQDILSKIAVKEERRIFVLPYQRARSEERFYFEQWALDSDLPEYIQEL